jgi:hypothetical protein
VKEAQGGSARDVSRAMYNAHWFTGTKGSDADRIEAYAKVIEGAASHVAKVLGVHNDVVIAKSGDKPSTTSRGGAFLVILLVAWALGRK